MKRFWGRLRCHLGIHDSRLYDGNEARRGRWRVWTFWCSRCGKPEPFVVEFRK